MTKPSATPPREWWVYFRQWETIVMETKEHILAHYPKLENPEDNLIHVIEHSALLSAQEELRYYKNEFENCAQARLSFNDDLKEQYKKIEGLERERAAYILSVKDLANECKQEIKSLRERVEVCKAALEFYGNWKSWDKDNRICTDGLPANIIDDDFSEVEYLENDGETYKDIFGGKRAREALEKIK